MEVKVKTTDVSLAPPVKHPAAGAAAAIEREELL